MTDAIERIKTAFDRFTDDDWMAIEKTLERRFWIETLCNARLRFKSGGSPNETQETRNVCAMVVRDTPESNMTIKILNTEVVTVAYYGNRKRCILTEEQFQIVMRVAKELAEQESK